MLLEQTTNTTDNRISIQNIVTSISFAKNKNNKTSLKFIYQFFSALLVNYIYMEEYLDLRNLKISS